MKKILVSLFILVGMTSLQANAFDFMSALKFWENAAETQTAEVQTAKTLTDIQSQMNSIDASVQNAFVDMVSDLSGWRETRTVKSNLKKQALSDVISSYTTTLANNKEDFVKKMSKLSSKEKKELVNDLTTLSQSGQQYLLLATDGVKAASNTLKTAQKLSDLATTVGNVNKVAGQLKTRATTVISFANQATTIAKAAGISVQ